MIHYILPQLKTIKGCLEELKTLDNNTAVSEWFIRQLCTNGQVDCRMTGNKVLVNFNSLIKYLGGEIGEVPDEE